MEEEKSETIPAIPPNDYEGSIADWIIELVRRGHFNDGSGDWYGDVMLTKEEYLDILNTCESKHKQ